MACAIAQARCNRSGLSSMKERKLCLLSMFKCSKAARSNKNVNSSKPLPKRLAARLDAGRNRSISSSRMSNGKTGRPAASSGRIKALAVKYRLVFRGIHWQAVKSIFPYGRRSCFFPIPALKDALLPVFIKNKFSFHAEKLQAPHPATFAWHKKCTYSLNRAHRGASRCCLAAFRC